jgi:hypothetical protein
MIFWKNGRVKVARFMGKSSWVNIGLYCFFYAGNMKAVPARQQGLAPTRK